MSSFPIWTNGRSLWMLYLAWQRQSGITGYLVLRLGLDWGWPVSFNYNIMHLFCLIDLFNLCGMFLPYQMSSPFWVRDYARTPWKTSSVASANVVECTTILMFRSSWRTHKHSGWSTPSVRDQPREIAVEATVVTYWRKKNLTEPLPKRDLKLQIYNLQCLSLLIKWRGGGDWAWKLSKMTDVCCQISMHNLV